MKKIITFILIALMLMTLTATFVGCGDKDVTDLKNQFDELSNKFNDLSNQYNELDERVKKLETTMSLLDTVGESEQFTELKNKVTALQKDLVSNTASDTQIKSQVTQMQLVLDKISGGGNVDDTVLLEIQNKLNTLYGEVNRVLPFENGKEYEVKLNGVVYYTVSKGKSLLCDCIDFVLGSGDNIFNKNGMQKVESIETVIKTDGGFLFFMRCKSSAGSIDDFFKKDVDASYIQINKDLYDEKITTALLNGNDDEVVNFGEVFDRRISHRATSFLNFLDQTGMGNLKYIYTKSNTDKYRWYYKDIFNFIFNNSNIKKIVLKTRELKEKEKILRIHRQREAKFSIQRDLLLSELQKLNINVGTITEAREALKNFELNYSRPELHSKEKDLKFLLMASQSLAEEIKVQECFNGQGKLLISRQKNIEKLLSIFQEIIRENENFKDYIVPIEEILKEAKNKTDTFSTIDINQTVKKLVKEKRDIDFQIQQLNIL